MSVGSKIKLNDYDVLFGGSNQNKNNDITEIDVSLLHEFVNHPFKVIDDEKMVDMIESIREYGVLTPILVRKSIDGYEIISGHRRCYACKKIGLEKIPAIIKELTDDEAIILMVDSNIQREEILPSEKAFAYKLKLDAMKNQGKRNDLTCTQIGYKLNGKKSVDILAEETGESRNQIQRYIRLTFLNRELLEMVDEKKIPLNVAYELSFLSEDELNDLWLAISEINSIPSIKQATKMKELSKNNKLTNEVIEVILTEEKDKPKKVNLKEKVLSQYFPSNYTSEQMEDTIIKLLEEWAKNNN